MLKLDERIRQGQGEDEQLQKPSSVELFSWE